MQIYSVVNSVFYSVDTSVVDSVGLSVFYSVKNSVYISVDISVEYSVNYYTLNFVYKGLNFFPLSLQFE